MSEQLPAELDLEAQMGLAEMVSRVLDRGAIITGEVTISVAGIDLVFLGLQLVVAATETLRPGPPGLSRSLR